MTIFEKDADDEAFENVLIEAVARTNAQRGHPGLAAPLNLLAMSGAIISIAVIVVMVAKAWNCPDPFGAVVCVHRPPNRFWNLCIGYSDGRGFFIDLVETNQIKCILFHVHCCGEYNALTPRPFPPVLA